MTSHHDRGCAQHAPTCLETLLIAVSQSHVRSVVAEYLRGCGFTVREAASGEEAVDLLAEGGDVDIVIISANLSGVMGGFALARHVQQRHPKIGVIMSGNAEDTVEKASDICSEGPAEAPFHPEELLRRIHALRDRPRGPRDPAG